jgi:hypothetical protein
MRQSTLVLILLTVAIGVGLFLVKYRVQGLEGELNNLNRDIASGRERIHVLKAEWSHFNEPGRLRALAGRHLDMIPLESTQVTTPSEIAKYLPNTPASKNTKRTDLAAESGDNAGKEFRP